MTAVKKVVSFLKPVTGSLIFGVQVGSRGEAGLEDDYDKKLGYRQNEETWRRMWYEVGKQTGSEWDVDFWWDETGSSGSKILEDFEARQLGVFHHIVRRR